jgi:hypothetical protein
MVDITMTQRFRLSPKIIRIKLPPEKSHPQQSWSVQNTCLEIDGRNHARPITLLAITPTPFVVQFFITG